MIDVFLFNTNDNNGRYPVIWKFSIYPFVGFMTHIYVQDMSFGIRLIINFFLQKVQVVSVEENFPTVAVQAMLDA